MTRLGGVAQNSSGHRSSWMEVPEMRVVRLGWLLAGVVLVNTGCTCPETKVVLAREPNPPMGHGIREFEISDTGS